MSVDQTPQVYDGATDTVIPVTQGWCDGAVKIMQVQTLQRGLARWVLGLNVVTDADILRKLTNKACELGMK